MSNENYNFKKNYNQEFRNIIDNTNLTPLKMEDLKNINPTDENFKANLFKLYKAYEEYLKIYKNNTKLKEQQEYGYLVQIFINTYKFKVNTGEIIKNFFIKYGSKEKESNQRSNVYRFIQQFSGSYLLRDEYSFKSIMNLTSHYYKEQKLC